jgi:hypothetical protein
MPQKSKKHTAKKRGVVDDPVAAMQKHTKKLVRTAANRRDDSGNVAIMRGIVSDLTRLQPTMTVFGAKYAVEELNIAPTFTDLAMYIAAKQLEHDAATDVISAIMYIMVVVVGHEWLPESMFGTIEKLIGTAIKSYVSIESLLKYIMDCELDEPSPKMVDDIIKSTQHHWKFGPNDARLKRYILANCNLYEQGGYLDYLANEKSAGLTQWFHPPAGHQQGDRLEYFELQRVQWTIRLVILSEHTSRIDAWERLFRMLGTLATNNEKFRASMTFKVAVRQLMINYGKRFQNYEHLFMFLEAMPENIVLHLKLSDDIDNYEMFISDTGKYISVLEELRKYNKLLVHFRVCVLARSVKCHTKYITFRVLHLIYGDRFCRNIQKRERCMSLSVCCT